MTQSDDDAHRAGTKAGTTYERWVRDHAAELYRFAYRFCGDRDVAEDLVQETFYEAWKSLGSLRHEDRARAWLYQILRHRYARLRRTESRTPLHVPLDSVEPAPSHAPSVTDSSIKHDALQTALNGLSDRVKVPLLMVFMEGQTCQEAADLLDLPLGTVLSRIHRAKRRLRELLRAGYPEAQSGEHDAEQPGYKIGGES